MKVETLHRITGIFKDCTIEPGLDGWSVFDSNREFICIITIFGVSLNDDYKHSKDLQVKLTLERIDFWSNNVREDLELLAIQNAGSNKDKDEMIHELELEVERRGQDD